VNFTDSILIDAPCRKVWECVGVPTAWPRFYTLPGKARCEQVSVEGGVVGSLYDMDFAVAATTTRSRAEIVDLRPGTMISVKFTLDEVDQRMGREWVTQITYELADEGCRTRVTERVDMTDFDLPINLAAKVIGWSLYRLRRLTGGTNLQRLKRVVEETF
jgi:uncharacterized protein YndB with AHSA1/START domain